MLLLNNLPCNQDICLFSGRLFSGRRIGPVCIFLFVLFLIVTPSQNAAAQIAKGWHLRPVPESWRSLPTGELAPVNGYSWYRVLVRIPAEWKDASLTMFVESLDDARSTWINGQQIGATGTFPPQFRSGLGERGRYTIDPTFIRAGEFNTIAIRIYQSDPRPNFSVAPPVLMNESAKQGLRLEGTWQYRPGDDSSWSTSTPSEFGFDAAQPLADADAAAKGVYHRIDMVDDIERYVTRRTGDTDPLSPKEAEKHFVTPDDLSVQLVLGDPDIAQPLFMMWDERARLWVLEYRQYPDPAGLTMLSRDTFLRSVYDKVPPAPPNHFRGRDRISIHEDTDGDGVYDRHSTFVDELNIASSFAIGHGGVYVTNPPYLLFYPDKNRDDIPDGDPEVLLEGFGIEDSHSVINSLRFGPDGWLYGGQGSTVTAAVKKPGSKDPPIRTVGQQIWRYHPLLQKFEVFAEGGGNTFGCEIDSKGRIYSGHNGGDTRGFHYVQGAYYRKGFGKHGPLSNPFSFGFFENMKHHSVARFTHNFILYEEGVLPERFQGKLFGIEPLQGQVVLSDVKPFKSSFETSDIERVLKTDDPWFRPVDIKAGPDGCIYVADMYEQRIDHSSHYAGRIDRSNGRIYRLKPNDQTLPVPHLPVADMGTLSGEVLLNSLENPARWHRQTALRLIDDSPDSLLAGKIFERLQSATGQTALELLWALNLCDGLTDDAALRLLQHEDQFVRAWTVRLLGDRRDVSPLLAEHLIRMAALESYLEVRKQLACSARRLPPEVALPVLNALLNYDEDAADIHQPLLLWWAIESQISLTSSDEIVAQLLPEAKAWHRPLVQQYVLQRLMQRYAASGTRSELLAAARLLDRAPDRESADLLLLGFEEAFQGRSLAGIPDAMVAAIAKSGGGSPALKLRQGQPEAVKLAIQTVSNPAAKSAERRQLIEIFGQIARPDVLPILLKLIAEEKDEAVLSATLTALLSFDDASIADAVSKRFSSLSEESRLAAESLMASRPAWSLVLLQAVENNLIPATLLTESTLRKMLLHPIPEIAPLIQKHWGAVAGASTAQMQAEILRISSVLTAGSGNPKQGKTLFMQNCGRCHLLFEEGGRIGPDLTPFARDNVERMLNNIINPNLEIREGFENHLVVTADGKVLNGFLADKDSQVVILRGVDGQNIIIPQSNIDEMRVIPQSVMPEGALKGLTDQQVRDLFAYLRSSQPVNY